MEFYLNFNNLISKMFKEKIISKNQKNNSSSKIKVKEFP